MERPAGISENNNENPDRIPDRLYQVVRKMAKEKVTFDTTENGIVVDSENFTGNTCLTELENFRAFMKENGGIDIQITNQQKKNVHLSGSKSTIRSER